LSLSASYTLTVCFTDINSLIQLYACISHKHFTRISLISLRKHLLAGLLHSVSYVAYANHASPVTPANCYTDTHRSRHMCTKLMRRTHPCSTHIGWLEPKYWCIVLADGSRSPRCCFGCCFGHPHRPLHRHPHRHPHRHQNPIHTATNTDTSMRPHCAHIATHCSFVRAPTFAAVISSPPCLVLLELH
jgi:hypothetical protein